jgi:Fe-S cluster biogenesis protein NfuA
MELDMENVRRVIATKLAPLVEHDGGELEVLEVAEKNGVVRLRIGGSYVGCPSREIFIRYVVVPTLRQAIPEINRVEWED